MHLDIIACIGVVLVGGALGWGQQVLLGGKDSLDQEQLLVIKKWLEQQESQTLEKTLSIEKSKSMPLDELLMIGLRRREGIHLEELAKKCWMDTKKKCDKNLKSLEKFWLNSINEGFLLRHNGRYFFK